MAGSLEAIGGQPGGSATRDFLAVTFNNDGSKISSNLITETYSASITPNASLGVWHAITVTDGSAFTINAPAGAPAAGKAGDLFFIEIVNSSGGVMGTITWNAVFVFAGVTWTKPASTKSRFVGFRWNGTSWICVAAAGADY